MRRLDQIVAGLLLALVLVMAVSTADLAYTDEITPGPRFMPVWVAVAGAVLAVLLLFEARRRADDKPAEWPRDSAAVRVMLAAGLTVAFAVISPWVGFLLTTVIFTAAMMLMVFSFKVVPSLVATAITTLLIYVVFVAWLGLPLPTSPFGI